MALTRRGRTIAATVTVIVVVAAVVFGVAALGSRGKPQAAGNTGGVGGSGSTTSPPPPPICPLTGVNLGKGSVPDRPALAVKVENLPAARPQTGLSSADIVYEEPVEANITRFIAVYQCHDAPRIEPVRSGRLTDPDVLVQFGRPIFAYAGGVRAVVTKVKQRGLLDVNFNLAPQAYQRDPARAAPHNLYTSTAELYAAAGSTQGPPSPLFTYETKSPKGAPKIDQAHVPFSGYSDVYWKWSKSVHAWLRYHGTVPHTLSDGTQVSAKNVIVQMVKVVITNITDSNGVASPEVVSTGSGKAYVLRNGRMVKGTWSRPSLSDVTKFVDQSGNEIPLTPGNTWIELVANTVKVTFN